MATLNKVMLIGRLTTNPEDPRTLPNSGTRVIRFRFAVGRSRKNQQTGQWENDPNQLYIDCEAFSRPDTKRDLVGLIHQYAKQGDQLFIEGRLQLDEWVDQKTQQKRSKHKVVVESIEFLGSRTGDDGGQGGGQGGGQAGGYRSGGQAAGRPANTRGDFPAPPDEGGDEHGGGHSGGDGDNIPF
ncbi:MAG: single-stranded DNA-binding protein [Gemmataceae bacterium]|nr:single-stranded DNA-binding protein [Gemmataceae bacterium]